MTGDFERAAEILAGARSALFITGAGLSADSGLPTYRGIGGLYAGGLTEEGIPIEQALSGHMMMTRPDVCWRHIAAIESACRGAAPNPGHRALARLESRLERAWVLTQNVDGLHRAAGSKNVIDIHGDVHDLLCTRCEWRETVEDFAALAIPPRCPPCGGLVRPDVVLFGEMLPPEKVARLRRELERGFDAVFSIGTSSLFPYISAPVLEAAAAGVPTVEINPAPTEVSGAALLRLRAGAARALEIIAGHIGA